VLVDEAADGGLRLGDRAAQRLLGAGPTEPGKQPRDRVEP
jgi:hypothetical protein